MHVIADRNKASFLKELSNDEDSTTCPDGDNHRAFSSSDDTLPATEENSYPNDMSENNMDVFSGSKNVIPIKEHAEGLNESYQHKFKMRTQNVNGLSTSSKFESLVDCMMKFKIDSYCVQET